MSDVNNTIKTLERSLHRSDIRSSADHLIDLLHSSFIEIGYSGNTYNLKQILETLTTQSSSHSIWSQDYEFLELAPGLIQVLYLSAYDNVGILTRHARRTSIWTSDSGHWEMRYHQATPTGSFERKSE